jgi:hypothetical protein
MITNYFNIMINATIPQIPTPNSIPKTKTNYYSNTQQISPMISIIINSTDPPTIIQMPKKQINTYTQNILNITNKNLQPPRNSTNHLLPPLPKNITNNSLPIESNN